MKTPEEILKGLDWCNNPGSCKKCPYYNRDDFTITCVKMMRSDAIELIRKLQDQNRALRTELTVNSGDYWKNICRMNARQEAKGMEKYGVALEGNTKLNFEERIEYLQEELIDALKYCEHLKSGVKSVFGNIGGENDR